MTGDERRVRGATAARARRRVVRGICLEAERQGQPWLSTRNRMKQAATNADHATSIATPSLTRSMTTNLIANAPAHMGSDCLSFGGYPGAVVVFDGDIWIRGGRAGVRGCSARFQD